MLSSYVGQRDAITPLLVAIQSSRNSGRPLPNMLFLGSAGRGKTTLAHAVADEMGIPFAVLHGSSTIEREVISTRIMEASGGVLFIDEIHALPRQLAEELYRVIDEEKLAVEVPIFTSKKRNVFIARPDELPVNVRHVYTGPGHYFLYENVPTKKTRIDVIDVGHVTVIGATTDEALLPTPFLSRLSSLIVRLRPYTIAELADIGDKRAIDLDNWLLPEVTRFLAERANSTPRRMIQLTDRAVDMAIAFGNATVTLEDAQMAVDAQGVDRHGLDAPHRAILQALRGADKGLSRTTLAQKLGIPPRNMELYWSDLSEKGFVEIDTRHRITIKGREAYG